MIVSIATKRLHLEPVVPEHVAELFAAMRDPLVSTYLAWGPHASQAETADLVQSLQTANSSGSGFHWAICSAGAPCGIVSLIDVRRQHRLWTLERAELAYWVSRSQQSQGFATEACTAVLDYGFTKLGLNRVIVSHTSTNPASARIPQKLGFTYIGRETEFFCKGGVWHDMNHYEITCTTWRARQTGSTDAGA